MKRQWSMARRVSSNAAGWGRRSLACIDHATRGKVGPQAALIFEDAAVQTARFAWRWALARQAMDDPKVKR